ncbi:MAG: GTPase, partial [Erysipelotrichaceae bacterium]
GYSAKASAAFCQRCFKIKHYGELMIDVKEVLNPQIVLQEIEKITATIIWVVDLFDFQASMKLPINRYLKDRKIILALTKRDLLPATLSNDKLAKFVLNQLKEHNIVVDSISVLANYAHDGLSELISIMDNYHDDFILMGSANSGKSTLLKALVQRDISVSLYPGTTLKMSKYHFNDKTIYDTPGLTNTGSVIQYADNKDLKQIIANKLSKVRHFQIYEDQSFAIGGLIRIDFIGVQQSTISFYLAETLKIHRGKLEKADQLWNNHYGQLLQPTINSYQDFKTTVFDLTSDKVDICLDGLGFICLSKKVRQVRISAYKLIDISIRKALI